MLRKRNLLLYYYSAAAHEKREKMLPNQIIITIRERASYSKTYGLR